jgi:hypothetical protein
MTQLVVGSENPEGFSPARIVRHPVTRILAVLALSRAVIVLLLLVLKEVPLAEPVSGGIGDLLCRFDCSWYLRIATGGYSIDSPVGPDNTTYAFFPLYPSIVGVVSRITTISPLTTGIILSTAFFAAALIYIYYYAREVGFAHRTGMLAVTILCFAPPSVVFSSVFSESLFVLLLAAAVLHLRREEYGRAALAAALLTATRPNGIAFIVFALIFALRRLRLPEFVRPWRRPEVYLPIVLAPLGLFAYWGFSYSTTGDAFAHISTNVHGWGWGMTGAIDMLTMFTRLDASDKLLMGVSGLTLALSFLLLRYRLFEDFGLVIASLAIYWTGGLAPWSMPRFALVLFPLSIVVARSVESRPGLATVLVAAAALIGGFILAVGWGMEGFVI